MGQASPVLVLKTRIALANVKGRMDHLSVDVKGQRLFATAFDNHTLEVIDAQAGRQVHTIADLDEPQGAFYDAFTNRLFVSSEGDGAVKIFDGTTFQLLQTVKLSSDADNVRYDARRKRVLVGYGGEKFRAGKVWRGQGDGALAFLDSTGKKTGEIAIDAHPESFQLEKSGNRVFVNVPDAEIRC
jgi:DNA-binding beta-propeller fold protein YncE